MKKLFILIDDNNQIVSPVVSDKNPADEEQRVFKEIYVKDIVEDMKRYFRNINYPRVADNLSVTQALIHYLKNKCFVENYEHQKLSFMTGESK